MVSLVSFLTFTLARAYVAPHGVIPQEVPVRTVLAMAQQPRNTVETIPRTTQEGSWNPLVFGMILGLFVSGIVGHAPAASAADAEAGSAVFASNCASCHAGGNNLVSPEKKLKKEELQKYGKYEPAQIVAQVTKGNGSMPAFGSKLAPEDIQDVAAYVRAQADKGW